MKKAATVTTVEECRALADYTPVMDRSKDVCMWVVDSDGERRLSSSFVGIMTPEETPEMVIDFPVTVLYPATTPQAGQLEELKAEVRAHIAERTDQGLRYIQSADLLAILDKHEVPEGKE